MATVALAVTQSLADGLIIATVSSVMGVIGMLGSAYISSRATRRIHPALEDLKGAVGADKRKTDPHTKTTTTEREEG